MNPIVDATPGRAYTPSYTPAQHALIERFLAHRYEPVGYRAQVMVGYPTNAAFEAAAVAAVTRAGRDPARRVALVHPRPGELHMREVDVLEFFRNYGHEYCVALLTAETAADVVAVTEAARLVGCAVLWDVSAIADVSVENLARWGVEAAVSTTAASAPTEFGTFDAI